MLPASKIRINKAIEDRIYYFSDKNTLHSTCAYKQITEIGFKKINEEVIIILEKLSALNELREEDLNGIKIITENFINNEYDEVIKYCKGKILDNPNVESPVCENLKKEAIGQVELYIEIQKQNIHEKRWKNAWDIFKVIASGCLGALLSLIVKK